MTCTVTLVGNMYEVSSPYIHGLVTQIRALPVSERKYDPAKRVWLVDPKYGQAIAKWIEKYAGEVVSVPPYYQTSVQKVMRIFEVKYIGACKVRDDGNSTAFGLVGRDWTLILFETVLRNWFDQTDANAAPSNIKTLYQVLGISQHASLEDLKTGYRRMSKQWHPDICKEPNATEVFLQIQEAYEMLSNPDKRARYDAGLLFQASIQEDAKKFEVVVSMYRSPLRCGHLLVEGFEKLGRFEVSRILDWQDIVKDGKTLVVSWPFGAKEPVEAWV